MDSRASTNSSCEEPRRPAPLPLPPRPIVSPSAMGSRCGSWAAWCAWAGSRAMVAYEAVPPEVGTR